jgi:hypothetical protein
MRILLCIVVIAGLVLAAQAQAHARHPQCPALLTDGECDQLEAIMRLREMQPEEYGRQIFEFARLMTERHQACRCDDWLIKWADSVHESFKRQGK